MLCLYLREASTPSEFWPNLENGNLKILDPHLIISFILFIHLFYFL